ncbi:MAG: TDP-Fuc4NAc [Prolixibacteraceae bacterium]|nr:MAG: TDP-Fuc4NAc [Prolixibacteraceae bacterium]
MTKYLHIAHPDNFILPLCDFIIKSKELEDHKFLFFSNQIEDRNYPLNSVFYISSPIRKNLINNLILFYRLCNFSDVIIIHGPTAAIFFKIFPRFTKKLVWIIYGHELYSMIHGIKVKRGILIRDSTKFTLKRAKKHLTHIEGDSILANKILESKAVFHYSPIYLSNVVNTDAFAPTKIEKKIKILVGNSNSPNNDHHTIFNELKKFENNIEYILSPLSYGNDLVYKETVKKTGSYLFGDKFKTIENFMPINEYNKVLSDVDIVVFNHWRQEAMGVTLTLLSLGKIVYVNPNTTSYKSLKDRGFKIFDNNLLFLNGPTIQRDVLDNKSLLEKYYSKEMLIASLKSLKI